MADAVSTPTGPTSFNPSADAKRDNNGKMLHPLRAIDPDAEIEELLVSKTAPRIIPYRRAIRRGGPVGAGQDSSVGTCSLCS
jgi:hypothetical protein